MKELQHQDDTNHENSSTIDDCHQHHEAKQTNDDTIIVQEQCTEEGDEDEEIICNYKKRKLVSFDCISSVSDKKSCVTIRSEENPLEEDENKPRGLCRVVNCTKASRGSGKYCISHGGGMRCSVEGCTYSARGKVQSCISHGGGNRCVIQGCTSGAIGEEYCMKHGGGKRCRYPYCASAALRKSHYCLSHLREMLVNKSAKSTTNGIVATVSSLPSKPSTFQRQVNPPILQQQQCRTQAIPLNKQQHIEQTQSTPSTHIETPLAIGNLKVDPAAALLLFQQQQQIQFLQLQLQQSINLQLQITSRLQKQHKLPPTYFINVSNGQAHLQPFGNTHMSSMI